MTDQDKLITSNVMESSRNIRTTYKEIKTVNIIRDAKNLGFNRINSKIRQKNDHYRS